MMGMIVTAFLDCGINIDHIIEELQIRGYLLQDISIIIKPKETTEEKGFFDKFLSMILPHRKSVSLNQLLSQAQQFPNLGDLYINGPMALTLNLILTNKSNPFVEYNSLFKLLIDFGIPAEDAMYFNEIVEGGGLIMVLPELQQLESYETFWSNGAERIIVLKDNLEFPNQPEIRM